MKKPLLLSLAAFSLSLMPPALAQQAAESGIAGGGVETGSSSRLSSVYYLVVVARNGGKRDYGTTSDKIVIPTANEMECEAAGLKLSGNKEIHGKIFEHLRYTCVKGVK